MSSTYILQLPLSFIAGIFSMNAYEINGYRRPIWQIMVIMSEQIRVLSTTNMYLTPTVPITLVVLTISLTLAYAGNNRQMTLFSSSGETFAKGRNERFSKIQSLFTKIPFRSDKSPPNPIHTTTLLPRREMPWFYAVRGPVFGRGRFHERLSMEAFMKKYGF